MPSNTLQNLICAIKNLILRSGKMKYTTANEILPDELLQQIQKYIQGQYIYIPKEKGCRAEWGTSSGAKKHTKKRNDEIKKKFLRGISKEILAETYCLSLSSIKKIVYK